MIPIAHVHSDFPAKFGVPRQAGLVPELRARVVFTPEFRNPDAVRGLDGFSHIWLIFQFHQAIKEGFSPTVRPPRLGGETRLGVFATRSPFRPNAIGLSSVRLLGIETDAELGPVLQIAGADLVDGTPVLDIKPYIGADQHPDAVLGFTTSNADYRLAVDFPAELLALVPEGQRPGLLGVLAEDPRPAYQRDPERDYGLSFAGLNVRFRVVGRVLEVVSVEPLSPQPRSLPPDHS